MTKTITIFRVQWHTITFKDGLEVNGGRGPQQTKMVGAKTPDEAIKLVPTPEQKNDGTEIRNSFLTARVIYQNVLVEG